MSVLVAAHVDDRVDVLDVDRALLDAGAAGRARPQHVGVDDGVRAVRVVGRERVVEVVAGLADQRRSVGPRRSTARRLRSLPSGLALLVRREQPGRLGVRVVAQRHDQQLGRQRLVGVPRRALRLAAAALGAGGEVEQALPGEVLDLADAERGVLVELLDVLEVDRLAPDHQRLQLAQGGAAVGVALEPDVGEGQEAVPGHAHRRLQGDGDHPRERDEDLDRRDDDDARSRASSARHAREDLADPPGQREVQALRADGAGALGAAPIEGVLQAAQSEDADRDAEDGELDVVGLPEGRAEEPRPAPALAGRASAGGSSAGSRSARGCRRARSRRRTR